MRKKRNSGEAAATIDDPNRAFFQLVRNLLYLSYLARPTDGQVYRCLSVTLKKKVECNGEKVL
jgi:hypothetical protein